MVKYFCLNCGALISFSKHEIASICEMCGWRNDLTEDSPGDFSPIVSKRKKLAAGSYQVCYPLISEMDLEDLPSKLKEGVLVWFKNPSAFTKKMYENIHHNLYEKNYVKFERFGRKYENKAKLAEFFQKTNFLKKNKIRSDKKMFEIKKSYNNYDKEKRLSNRDFAKKLYNFFDNAITRSNLLEHEARVNNSVIQISKKKKEINKRIIKSAVDFRKKLSVMRSMAKECKDHAEWGSAGYKSSLGVLLKKKKKRKK